MDKQKLESLNKLSEKIEKHQEELRRLKHTSATLSMDKYNTIKYAKFYNSLDASQRGYNNMLIGCDIHIDFVRAEVDRKIKELEDTLAIDIKTFEEQ